MVSTKLNKEAYKAVEVAANYNKDPKKIDKDLENLFNLINTLVTNPPSRSSLVLHIAINDVPTARNLSADGTEIPISDCSAMFGNEKLLSKWLLV